MASIAWFLKQREKAYVCNAGGPDYGMIRAINADLARLGYVETLPEAARPPAMETTSLAMPEHAVPTRPRGRPPKVRE